MFRLIRTLFKLCINLLAVYGAYTLYCQYFRNFSLDKFVYLAERKLNEVLDSQNLHANNYINRSNETHRYYQRTVSRSFSFPVHDTSVSDIRKKVCKIACSYVGTRYRRGGTNYKGVDCSGLVYAVYNRVMNADMPRNVVGLYDIATKVDTPLPGDLVFFKINHLHVDHVGIYLGNGKMIHASSHKGVCIVSLDKDYYRRHFYAFGRLIIGK